MRNTKYMKSKIQKYKEILTSVLTEMAQLRFAESAQEEEEDINQKGHEICQQPGVKAVI